MLKLPIPLHRITFPQENVKFAVESPSRPTTDDPIERFYAFSQENVQIVHQPHSRIPHPKTGEIKRELTQSREKENAGLSQN